jgi:uncharacterized alkaline shock family protein YloU
VIISQRTAVTTSTSNPPGAQEGPGLDYVVREPVIAAIAAHAAAGVAGVLRTEPSLSGLVTSMTRSIRQRMAGVDAAPTEGVRAEVDGGLVWLEVAVAIRSRAKATAVGQAVQRAVAEAVREATGYAVAEVAVSILHIDLPAVRKRP